MFDQLSLKALCEYERLTKKNAFELFNKENKSATDLRDMVFLVMYTKDSTVTFDKVENLTPDEFGRQIEAITPKKSEPSS